MAATTRVDVLLSMKWGPSGKLTFYVDASVVSPSDPIILGLIAVLEDICRGSPIQLTISLSAAPSASVTTGVAYVSEDKALFRFKDDDGVGHAYKIPGFLAAILQSDKETVNNGNALVIAYKNAVLTNAKTRNNEAITVYVSGHRIENRKPIKKGAI